VALDVAHHVQHARVVDTARLDLSANHFVALFGHVMVVRAAVLCERLPHPPIAASTAAITIAAVWWALAMSYLRWERLVLDGSAALDGERVAHFVQRHLHRGKLIGVEKIGSVRDRFGKRRDKDPLSGAVDHFTRRRVVGNASPLRTTATRATSAGTHSRAPVAPPCR
jgi:hypothetical protein